MRYTALHGALHGIHSFVMQTKPSKSRIRWEQFAEAVKAADKEGASPELRMIAACIREAESGVSQR